MVFNSAGKTSNAEPSKATVDEFSKVQAA
jgi:hypothetical protein